MTDFDLRAKIAAQVDLFDKLVDVETNEIPLNRYNTVAKSVFVKTENGTCHLRLCPIAELVLLRLNKKYNRNWTLGDYAQMLAGYPNLRIPITVPEEEIDHHPGPWSITNVHTILKLQSILDDRMKMLPASAGSKHIACFDEALMGSYAEKKL